MSFTKTEETADAVIISVEQGEPQHAAYAPSLSAKLGSARQIKGAAVAGGVTGLVLAGPAAGLLVAGGAALATGSKGEIGKAARVTGDSMSDLGRSLKKFEKKHSITKRTAKGIVQGCDWVSAKLRK